MRIKVVVAFGGESVEHEISILSAHQVMQAMNPMKYEVIPLYIAKDGRLLYHPLNTELERFENLDKVEREGYEVSLQRRGNRFYMCPNKYSFLRKEISFDMVFPILHGTHGEDGTFQGYLSTLHIPYIGCSVLGGAIGQDKIIMKQILEDSGLPVAPWFYWTLLKPLDDTFFRKAERLSYPLIVKPANLGSSIGVAKVENEVELHRAMIEAYQYDDRVVIEKAIEHVQEINCAVLGDEQTCEASVLEEVLSSKDILSYADKYVCGEGVKGIVSTRRCIPARIDEELALEIQTLAKECFRCLCASGTGRIDFLYNRETKDLYINEINTIPGSLAFYLWEKSDLPFPKLIDRLVQIAKKRYAQEQKRVYSYSVNILRLQGKGK